jgi:FtsP/CotA-like multicopper oxidase with cupredoxin domain
LVRKTLLITALLCLLSSCNDSKNTNSKSSFPDPAVFVSANGVLDLLMIAEPSPVTLGAFKPTAWVFEVCKTSDAQNDQCPSDSRTASPYGGVRLQLTAGDHLRIKLVNHLPPAPPDAEHAHGDDPMMNEMLAANPINLHTHGLIVEPRKADASDPTYGDYVYVLGYPSGKLPAMVDPDETATDKPIQYDIYIPTDHPSGIFYFHPHVHGLSVNHLTEGLSGVLTIGSVSDYLSSAAGIPVHYFTLKDMQMLASGEAQDQLDAEFCQPDPVPGETRNGSCDGADFSKEPDPGANYTGGKWFFTVNGQQYPQLSVTESSGEIWRFLNAAASRSYDLVIEDDTTHNPVQFQVVSLDGVALAPPPGSSSNQIRALTGGKVDAVPCTGAASTGAAAPVCAAHLVMLPSSRAEIWIAPSSASSTATLRTRTYTTGAAGDSWPSANLAHIAFGAVSASSARAAGVTVRPVAQHMLSSSGILGAPVAAGFSGLGPAVPLHQAQLIASGKAPAAPRALTAPQIKSMQARLADLAKPVPSIASPDCSALPSGHRRRIFFGIPAGNPDGFGLGYEEVDSDGNPITGTFQDIAPFDPDKINICLPLGSGNTPVSEEWELVNVAGETHNFHLHQTRFTVETTNAPQGDGGVLMDNVPLPNGGGDCDGSVATWRSGACKVAAVRVKIPFAEVGDFVYHCHIGEHQDGGMMAHIRVIANQ